MSDAATRTHSSGNGAARSDSSGDGRVLDLLSSSGVLNPSATLDTLMDVARQLAEIDPGLPGFATAYFHGSWYVYKQIVR
jgi:hypothetical protein